MNRRDILAGVSTAAVLPVLPALAEPKSMLVSPGVPVTIVDEDIVEPSTHTIYSPTLQDQLLTQIDWTVAPSTFTIDGKEVPFWCEVTYVDGQKQRWYGEEFIRTVGLREQAMLEFGQRNMHMRMTIDDVKAIENELRGMTVAERNTDTRPLFLV